MDYELGIMQYIQATKNKQTINALWKHYLKYHHLFTQPLFRQHMEEVKNLFIHVPVNVYKPAIDHCIQTRSIHIPQMTVIEKNYYAFGNMYFSFYHNHIFPLLNHFVYIKNQHRQKTVSDTPIEPITIQGWLTRFMTQFDIPGVAQDVFTRWPHLHGVFFVAFDNHPYIFPCMFQNLKGVFISNYRWFM